MMDTEMDLFPEKAKVVGIGKVVVSANEELDYNIPHLHFLVVEGFSEKGVYDSLNLEYGIHCSASSPKEAFLGNYKRVNKFFELNKIDSPEKFRELIKEQDNHYLSDYWRVFRKTEMELATRKQDLGSALLNDFRKEIEQDIKKLSESMDEKLKDIQEQLDYVATSITELQEILEQIREMDEVLSSAESLQFTEFERAA